MCLFLLYKVPIHFNNLLFIYYKVQRTGEVENIGKVRLFFKREILEYKKSNEYSLLLVMNV